MAKQTLSTELIDALIEFLEESMNRDPNGIEDDAQELADRIKSERKNV
jgi:hypothetical protein